MEALRIIDLSKDEKTINFENTGLILITGITEANLNDAITLAESARESGVVSVGIPEGDIASGNEVMKRFTDIADAVIFTREKTEGISQRIAEDFSVVTRDRDIFDIRTITTIFRNAGTVHYGSGSGDDIDSAIREAAEVCGDIHGAKGAVYQIIAPKGADWTKEIYPSKNTLKDICGDDVELSFSICHNSKDGKFTAKIFAIMNDSGYTEWGELFKNENEENITVMIKNGLDERTRTRLGTEKSFFAACLRFGTPELVRKFIRKGHTPKELETDGVFPGDILADCLKNDMNAGNTGMTDILLEADISLGEHCVKSLTPSVRNPKILQAFINYGWDVNSRDEEGFTFLAYAAAECSYECVKLLVEAGADVNARYKDGYTPLMMIDFGNYTDTAHEILKYLLANVAYINASADDGATALTQAAKYIYARPDIVRTFLNARANVNAEFIDDDDERKSVLDIMFESAASVASEPEEKQIFLGEVLPMMISAGAKINLDESRAFIDEEYQYFRKNWQNLLTEQANKPHALRLFCDSIMEYDIETIRGIIERISPEKIIPDSENPAQFLRMSERLVFRINDFPEAVSNPSPRHAEIKRKLEKGAEILRILKEAGIEWPVVPPEGTELTYIINEKWSPRRNIDGMNPLCLCHSPEALKKVIASEKYDTTDALKEIAAGCESYYHSEEMMKVLLDNGADIHSLTDTWVGECLSHRGKRLMLNNFQQAKFMAEIFRKHNPSDIITVKNARPYDEWDCKYFGGALGCHMLSHLWEMIETGTDNGRKWVKFRDVMMLLSACWGNVKDIEDSINYGGNVNYSTWLGYTPLMYASVFNSPESVKFLVKNGADINARNIHNQNAAMLSVTSDYEAGEDSEVIRVLTEFGADIHNGLMGLALDFGNVNTVKVLLSLGAKLPEENAVNDPEPVTRNEKYCPKCGRIFARKNDYCPSCGYVLPVSERY